MSELQTNVPAAPDVQRDFGRIYMEMRKDQKNQLLQALRSGDYVQNTNRPEFMRVNDTYTVLGVMCELYNQTLKGNAWHKPYGEQEQYHFLKCMTKLPFRVKVWFGIWHPLKCVTGRPTPRGMREPGPEEMILQQAGFDHTFQEIADWIERNL